MVMSFRPPLIRKEVRHDNRAVTQGIPASETQADGVHGGSPVLHYRLHDRLLRHLRRYLLRRLYLRHNHRSALTRLSFALRRFYYAIKGDYIMKNHSFDEFKSSVRKIVRASEPHRHINFMNSDGKYTARVGSDYRIQGNSVSDSCTISWGTAHTAQFSLYNA